MIIIKINMTFINANFFIGDEMRENMGKAIKKIILFIIIMMTLGGENISFAFKIEQSNNSVVQIDRVNFYNLTKNDGLSSNIITDIYQDSRGYIWIGTEDGLNKYNGNFIIEYNYEIDDTNSLSSPNITSINEDANGDLWIGTSGGLDIINIEEDRVIRVQTKENDNSLSHSKITSIYRDSNGVMWVGTTNGLNRCDEKNNKFIKYYADESDKSITNSYITDIKEDDLGYLWVCTKKGINVIDINTYEVFNISSKYNNDYNIYNINKDNEGNMWISTYNGIIKYSKENYKIYNFQGDIGEDLNNSINKVFCDSNNIIWLASSNGLIRYNVSDNTTKIYNVDGIPHNYLLSDLITCIYEDRNGVMWIGTDNGISILNTKQQFSNKINNILEDNGIHDSTITTFLIDGDNDLWIGTMENGLLFFDVDENRMLRFIYDKNNELSLLSNTIKEIVESKDNRIIVATAKGMNIIDKKNWNIYHCNEEVKETHLFDKGLKMLNDGRSIWVATVEGLYKSDNQTYEIINYRDHFIEKGINNYQVFDIYQDKSDENILWLAGEKDGGLIKFHKTEGIIKNYLLDIENNLSSYNAINCIQGDGEGNIWIGTEAGLNKFNIKEETFVTYSEKDGLRSDYINSIIIDNNKDIWLGTTDGLSKFIINENKFINFTEIDGIYGSQFSKRAVYKTKEGHLLFGTTKGVVSFNPDYIEEIISKDEEIVFGDLWIDRKLYFNKSEEVELNYNENNITIEYFLPDYSKIGSITYLYKMDGVSEEWNIGNSDGYMSYTMLKPGNYKFRVKAVKGDGSLTEESSIVFKIKKPFWKSYIAYGIYIFCAAMVVIFLWYRVRFFKILINNQTKEINRQMEKNKQLYEKIIRNEKFKNDYFVNLSHELRTPINIILSVLQLLNFLDRNGKVTEEKILHYMDVIRKSSNSLLNIINDIIDSSKIESGAYKINKQENVDIVYLVEETALSMSDYINSKGIELIIDPEVEELPICCDSKEIERCIVNLIGNAVKFTEKDGQIKVLIKENDNTVSISIEDNGIGISKDDQEFIFKRFEQGNGVNPVKVSSSGIGLTLVKYIVELHGGHVYLESELDKGSKFTIILPII